MNKNNIALKQMRRLRSMLILSLATGCSSALPKMHSANHIPLETPMGSPNHTPVKQYGGVPPLSINMGYANSPLNAATNGDDAGLFSNNSSPVLSNNRYDRLLNPETIAQLWTGAHHSAQSAISGDTGAGSDIYSPYVACRQETVMTHICTIMRRMVAFRQETRIIIEELMFL